MFIAYMDESGTHDESEFAALAGYVDHSSGWTQFETAWKAVLVKYRVSEFHMTDFENRYGEFDWQKYWFLPDKELRHPFMCDIIHALDPPKRLRVGCTISLRDYREIIPECFHKDYSPYYFLFAKCIEQLWRVSFLGIPPDEELAFVFDEKLGFEGRATAIFLALRDRRFPYSDRMGGIQFASSKKVVPLQAADLVAFEYRKYGEREVHKTGRPVRWPMLKLCANGAKGMLHHIHSDSLKSWVARQTYG
ncbi:DUF3800 domain-containing protein [Candidatus Binatus sp.]|uniref:DUF3800 domain-containing protein n=1 Tax=Candidatus Binatus sp. TaxID=2811406 RepID=UPI003BBA9BEC